MSTAKEYANKVKDKVAQVLAGPSHEFEFEKQITEEKRRADCNKIMERYPERVPVVCERAPRGGDVPQINSKKFLVPKQMSVSQLIVVVKNQLGAEGHPSFNENAALYFTLRNRTTLQPNTKLEVAHNEHRSPDGFLYMHYSVETVFG